MKRFHTFVDRNVILYLAIVDSVRVGTTASDLQILD